MTTQHASCFYHRIIHVLGGVQIRMYVQIISYFVCEKNEANYWPYRRVENNDRRVLYVFSCFIIILCE